MSIKKIQFRGKGISAFRKKKKGNLSNLSRRVTNLEKARDFDITATNDDDTNVFTTPVVITISLSGAQKPILLSSLHMKGVIVQSSDSADSILTRIVLVRMHANADPDNDTPTWLQVFKTIKIFSHRLIGDGIVYDKNFTIIYDKVFKTARDIDGTINSKIFFQFKKHYKFLKVDDGVTNARTNGFYLMMVSTGATGNIDVSTSIHSLHQEVQS